MALPTPGQNDAYTQGFIDAIRNGVPSAWVTASGTNTYTLDTAVADTLRLSFSAGGSPTIALTNPVDGRLVRVVINMGATALTAITWPAGIFWPYGVPQILTSGINVITLRYDTTLNSGAWIGIHPTGVAQRTVLSAPVVHTNEYPTAIDAKSEYHEIINTGGSNITVSTPTNPLDGQLLRIMYYRSGTQTITWPSGFRWAANTAPAAPTAATRNYYTFRYKAASGLWFENGGRVEGVPNT